MMLRKIPVCLLFCLAACTIIPDDAVEDFPKNVRVNQLKLRLVNKENGAYKYIDVKLVHTTNKIEINWPTEIDFLFYNKNMIKTVYSLNNAGYATKISTTFADGKEVVDEIVYDGSNRVAELKNSFFNDNLKLYYANGQLDSVSKTRTLTNTPTQTGFYKRVDEFNFISIFPFNKTQGYSLYGNFYGNCECSTTAPVPNELNRTNYSFTKFDDPYYTQFYTDNNYIQFLNNQYCKQVFSSSVFEGSKNFYNQPRNLDCFVNYCYSETDNYLSSYLLLPQLIPDYSSLYLITVDSEVRWIKSNPAKTSKWRLEGVEYDYAPNTK